MRKCTDYRGVSSTCTKPKGSSACTKPKGSSTVHALNPRGVSSTCTKPKGSSTFTKPKGGSVVTLMSICIHAMLMSTCTHGYSGTCT